MKKIIKKFWGVAFIVVLLSTLFVGSLPQAAAGTQSFTVAAGPNILTVGGAVVTDYAVASDGTVYAVTTGGAARSTTGGRSWVPLAPGLGAGLKLVAVAPDKPGMVTYIDITGNVSVSTDAGVTWVGLGQARDFTGGAIADNVTSVDISITTGGVNYIGVVGQDAGVPTFYYYAYGPLGIPWREATTDTTWNPANINLAGQVTFSAVKFSPVFNTDFIVYLVSDTATGARLHVASFNSREFDIGIPGFPGYVAAGTPLAGTGGALGSTIGKAQIIFDPDYYGGYEESRIAYISVNAAVIGAGVADGRVVRVTDNAGPVVTSLANAAFATNGVYSIALKVNADASRTLVAAAAASNAVYTAASPAFIFAPSRVVKRIGAATGADNQTVAYSGDSLYCSKIGNEGAFSLSTDNGYIFNDISYVNTAITNIVDFAVSVDGTKRYVVSNDTVDSSVFYFNGTYWERTRTFVGSNVAYVVGASPDNFDVLYVAEPGTAIVHYTASAGRSNWLQRTSPIAFNGLVDLEVQDNATFYVTTLLGGATGVVTQVSVTGLIWGPIIPPFGPAVALASLTLVSPNNLVAGSATGLVAYSTDGGLTWTPTLAAVPGGANRVYTAATGLAANGVIYAVTDNASGTGFPVMYSWTIGTSLIWTAVNAGPISGATSTGIALSNSALYRITRSSPLVNDVQLSRAFVPGGLWGTANISQQLAPNPTTAFANVVPNVLKVSAGNQLWFIDNSATGGADRIITYTDALASSVPVLTNPLDTSLIQVNNLTGIAYDVTLQWTGATGATAYRIQVALDSAFNNVVLDNPWGGFPLLQRMGPGQAAPWTLNYQPGQTYYWRIRATAPFYSGWSTAFSLNVQPGQALVPALGSPANGGSVSTLKPSFSWTPMGGMITYRFELDTEPTFAAPLTYTIDTASTGVSLSTALVNGTSYYWRVRVITPVAGDWSTVANFIVTLPTEAAPPVIITSTPAPTIILTQTMPAPTTVTTTHTDNVVNPVYIWVIIAIGAVLVVVIIVLIFRTKPQ